MAEAKPAILHEAHAANAKFSLVGMPDGNLVKKDIKITHLNGDEVTLEKIGIPEMKSIIAFFEAAILKSQAAGS
jgi:hypothetical protein